MQSSENISEFVNGNVDRIPNIIHQSTDNPLDKKEYLVRNEFYDFLGPYSYQEILKLIKDRKVFKYDFIAKHLASFEVVTTYPEFKELFDSTPELSEETTSRFTSITSTIESTSRSEKNLNKFFSFLKNYINLSIIPIHTFLWIFLFILVAAYCLYYIIYKTY